jgi:3-isopropylmalate/(R)-2-methylmalate dehydratase small subunit
MEPVRRITGTAVPLDRADVDTDQIIPKQFLKRVERSGFGPFLFYDWAKEPSFELNQPQYRGATILLAGPNFGCGSSREHAPWALEDAGFRAIIAPSFADIFHANCTKIGLLPVTLASEIVRQLTREVQTSPSSVLTIDLEAQTVSSPGTDAKFEFDAFTRWRLLEGFDDIGLTERHLTDIESYESRRPDYLPTTN